MGLRILIVEDDKHIRRILEALLKNEPSLASRSPEVTVAQNGKEGLAELDSGAFDLVISDLLMPGMDGFQFCHALRQHRDGATVPLIVMSAVYKDSTTIARLHSEVKAEFFTKPFQVRELMTVVRRMIGDPLPRGRSETPARAEAVPLLAKEHAGSLGDRSAARLLCDLHEDKASGTLRLRRGKVEKQVTFQHGTPVHVTSNLRTETLGHFLVSRGVIDEAQHQEALARAQASQDRLGQVLIELGLLTEKQLLLQLGAQTQTKLANVLRWSDGDWAFVVGRPPADRMQIPVDLPHLLFAGLRRTGQVDEIAQALAKVQGTLVFTARAERLREPFVRVFGEDGYEAVARRPRVAELLGASDPGPNLLQLDAMLVTGLVEIEPAEVRLHDSERADPLALERILSSVDPELSEKPATVQPASRSLYDELFSEDPWADSKRGPEGAATDAPAAAAAIDPFDEESGVVSLPVAQADAPAPLDAATEALRKELLTEYLAVQGRGPYEVLGVTQGATPAEIVAAYAEKSQRFRLERFSGIDLGRDYVRVEELHQLLRQAFELISSPERRREHDARSAGRAPPSGALLNADLLAQEAERLLAENQPAEARTRLERAVELAPDQADYHALIGWATFLAEGGGAPNPPALRVAASVARLHLDQAFAIDSYSVEGHEYAGRIAAALDEHERAIEHLERVLDADPQRSEALTALEGAFAALGDWKRLERRYRKLIHRLSDRQDPGRELYLWWSLAQLYDRRLGDRESARVAYEIVARLSPDDPRAAQALARLYAGDPASWARTADALRESWRLAPAEPEPGRALFQLHQKGERWDAAFLAASALACRGAAEGAAADFFRQHRPRFLVRLAGPLDDEALRALRHPDDDTDLEALFARLYAVQPAPFALGDLRVENTDRIAADGLPEPFARVLAYASEVLRVAPLAVYRRADFAAGVHLGAADPPVLLAGPQAIALDDRAALAFRLGRALSYVRAGRGAVAALPSRELKKWLLGLMTAVKPGLRIDDPDGEIAERARALTAAAPGLPRELAQAVERVLRKPQLNLSRYARGIGRTADRIGLFLCGDLPAAARIVAEEGAAGADAELIDFALEETFLNLRERLGVSIAV